MANHVIYIPGLGDNRTYNQDKALKLWRLYGLHTHYHAIGWADDESFKPKLQRLLDKIDDFQRAGHDVSLIGVSAGASAVINAYAARDSLKSVICIVGKIHNPQTVGKRIYDKNPAFRESLSMVEASLERLGKKERARILSLYPIKDLTVPIKDTFINGARMRKIFAFGHIQAIFICLLFYGPLIGRFMKHSD